MFFKKNIMFIGRVTDQQKFDILRGAKGFIQASKEDFGISSVEAQACGIPVIAFGEGGALETVIGTQSNDNPTGLFFYKQSENSKQYQAFHVVFGRACGATLTTLNAKKIPLSSVFSMLQLALCLIDCFFREHCLAF